MREAGRRFGDRTAYIMQRPGSDWDDALHLTYRDLDRVSDEVASAMQRNGVGPGSRVALILPPGLEYLVSYLAAAKLGAITAGINDRLAPNERATMLGRCEPKLVLAAPGYEPQDERRGAICVTVGRCETIDSLLAPLRDHNMAPTQFTDPQGTADVAIIFTSGTTGAPKGARYGTRQLDFITNTDIGDAWDLGGRTFTGTSFAHLGFMTKLQGNLRRGGTTFIMPRWSPSDSLRLLSSQHMTTVAGVPTQLALLLREPDFDQHDLSSVRHVVVGGGPITAGLAEETRRRFDAQLQTRYSCTEAGIGLGTSFDDPHEDAIVSVGRPHDAVQLTLRDPDDPTSLADRANNEIGEVCLRSPACMSGYWDDPVATAAAFTADGFVRTGDLGYVDDQGRVHLVGRSKEMYVRGGYNVYPVEVETVLSEHPDVAAVAIVPRGDPVMGEIGVACVVMRPGKQAPTVVALRAFGQGRLASYKLPEAVASFDEFPLTPMDKLDRAALRARAVDH